MILLGGRLAARSLSQSTGPSPGTAVVISDSTISFVGSRDGARAAAPDQSVIDLGGALITPAFVDAHVHLVQTGLVMAGLDLHGVTDRSALLDAVAARARAGATMIFGQGWDERAWPDPQPPTRAELDAAAGSVPVYLARVDVHSAVINSALLDRLPDLSTRNGYRSDGLLTRDAHHRCRGSLDQLIGDEPRRAAARAGIEQAARLGVGTVHEMGGPHLGPLADLTRVRDAGAEVGVRVVTYWGELAGDAAFARAAEVGAAGLAGDLCVDGAIGSRTAALRESYVGGGSGTRYLSVDEITGHVLACTRAGRQAGFHCIGDDAVAAAVEGLRRAAEQVGVAPIRAARHRLEHVEMVDRADLATLADLGVAASVQPSFDAAWGSAGELYEQRLGAARSSTMNPFGSMARSGVRLAFGTDAPVTPLTGWGMVADAVRHSRADERLSVAEAFAAATTGGHQAAGDDHAGRLEIGRPADLAIWSVAGDRWDADSGLPILDDGEPLPTCLATIVNGRIAYAADHGPLAGRGSG